MFLLVGCHKAAPKYSGSMFWCLLFCVISIKTLGTFADNTTGVVANDICTDRQFQCANGLCIHISWVCEGDDDCGDNSDETLERCKAGKTEVVEEEYGS